MDDFFSDIGFLKRISISQLFEWGITCIPGYPIHNSDKEFFYPDLVGLYNPNVNSLSIKLLDDKPVTVSVYIENRNDFNKRILNLLDFDTRWPTEIIMVLSSNNNVEIKNTDLFYLSMGKTGKLIYANKGIVKTHDQIGIQNLLLQILTHAAPYAFIGQAKPGWINETKHHALAMALRVIIEFLTSENRMTLVEFQEKMGMNRVRGGLFEKLSKTRSLVKMAIERGKIYGK